MSIKTSWKSSTIFDYFDRLLADSQRKVIEAFDFWSSGQSSRFTDAAKFTGTHTHTLCEEEEEEEVLCHFLEKGETQRNFFREKERKKGERRRHSSPKAMSGWRGFYRCVLASAFSFCLSLSLWFVSRSSSSSRERDSQVHQSPNSRSFSCREIFPRE